AHAEKPVKLPTHTSTIFLIFFFFSSRRRHTRFSRDWSSDVCSSDLIDMIAMVFSNHGYHIYVSTFYKTLNCCFNFFVSKKMKAMCVCMKIVFKQLFVFYLIPV